MAKKYKTIQQLRTVGNGTEIGISVFSQAQLRALAENTDFSPTVCSEREKNKNKWSEEEYKNASIYSLSQHYVNIVDLYSVHI